MAWTMLFFAGLFEVGWAIGLKYTDGFTRIVPTVLTVASMIVSLWLLGLALKSLPVGTAYAVWTGIGTVGTALLGIWLLGEPATIAAAGLHRPDRGRHSRAEAGRLRASTPPGAAAAEPDCTKTRGRNASAFRPQAAVVPTRTSVQPRPPRLRALRAA